MSRAKTQVRFSNNYMTVHFPTAVLENRNLAHLTTWKVGGPARWFAEPSAGELPLLLEAARDQGVPTFMLGRGSNLLVPDEGFDGLVVATRTAMLGLRRREDRILAEAGVSLPKLARFAANQGFSGYEFLVGIPGSVGGGVAMNAGLTAYYHREIREIVDWIEIVDEHGTLQRVDSADAGFSYRRSRLLDSGAAIVRACFKLEDEGDPEELHAATLEHHRERKRKQPLDKPTAGSTFKSPPGERGAGYLIELAGLKGFSIGGATISEKHANWIENRGGARAADIKRLIEHVRKTVEKRTGVLLDPEIRELRIEETS